MLDWRKICFHFTIWWEKRDQIRKRFIGLNSKRLSPFQIYNMIIQAKVLWILGVPLREILLNFGMESIKTKSKYEKQNPSFVQGLFNFDNCMTRPLIGDTKYNAHSPHSLYIVYVYSKATLTRNIQNEWHYSVCWIVDKLISGKTFSISRVAYACNLSNWPMCVNVNHRWMV